MKRIIPIVFILIVVFGGVWAYQSGILQKNTGQKGSSKKALYYCPMHPTYTSDRPGSCPICNMTLVKRESEQSAGLSESMDAQGMQNMSDSSKTQAENTGNPAPAEHQGHNTDTVASAGAMKSFTVEELMKMKPNEICLLHKCKMGQCMIVMTPEIAKLGKCPHCGEDLGVIVKNAVPQGLAAIKLSPDSQRAIGIETEAVKKMAITKSIRTVGRIAYDPELYQTQQEYLQAIQALKKAENAVPEIKEQAAKLVESAKIKLRLLGLNSDLVSEIETLGKPDSSLLYSDAGGKVWLYAPIYEYEMSLVKIGDTLTIESTSVPGKTFQGTIRSIDSVLDPMTRTVRVRAILDNPDGLLKPEMYVNASLQIALGENLVVPKDAVFMTGKSNVVFVAGSDRQYQPREVSLGAEVDNYYQVKGGLQEGELVVTSGNFLIDSESQLKAAIQGMGSGGGHQHGA